MVLERKGPLVGLTVIEFAGIGPGPFCAMLLADLGADVIRIERHGAVTLRPFPPEFDVVNRGRRSLSLDIKNAQGREIAERLIAAADVVIEGYRPGVMERLGLGPEPCLERNPRLVYGRMTGFGQEGPLSQAAGHDINYIALAGALGAIGPAGARPVPPLNLVGDYGGGGLLLAFGIVAALFEREKSSRGQVVDAAMVDGAATLMTMFFGAFAAGGWRNGRGANMLDGGAPFYDTYETGDGRFVAVGALEPQFFAELAAGLGLDPDLAARRTDPSAWPELRAEMGRLFKTRGRDEWSSAFEGTNACVTPVLGLDEAPAHSHLAARATFETVAGITQPAPSPRFSRTPGAIAAPPTGDGADSDAILAEIGLSPQKIAQLRRDKVI